MNKWLRVFSFVTLVAGVAASAQTSPSIAPQPSAALAPELVPYAAKHRADLATAEQQRLAALAAKLPFYLNPLDQAERSALAQANLDAVAAIHAERDAVKGGKVGDIVAAPFPEKLPAGLKSSRDSFFADYKVLDAAALKRRQQADADYVRVLAGLQARVPANSALALQIKAESDAVLGAPVTKPEGEVEVTTKMGKLINGDFTQADGKGLPVGWKLVDRNANENPVPAGETYKVVQESNRSFLHTAREDPKGEGVRAWQVVDVPSFAKECEFKFQARTAYTGKPAYDI